MKTAYIFDVDGTLTPSRGLINPIFQLFMCNLCDQQDVYLVTGSDMEKTVEQLGPYLTGIVKRSYNCSGNSIWEQGINIHNNEWTLPEEAVEWLQAQLVTGDWKLQTGKHFDVRPGLVNFSVLGRNATTEQRAEYVRYDNRSGARLAIAGRFNARFGEKYNVIAQVAGETGLDITGTGLDKSQIIKDFDGVNIKFFGDKMQAGGNDHTLAEAIKRRNNPNDAVYPVHNYQHTWQILQSLQ
jgi:phosphomannomutase